MDASDEFRFVVVNGTLHNNNKKHTESSGGETGLDRSVPVCVYNTNKNLKLRFLWDRAFKLFHSHRTIYRAVSGINYQDYGGGGGGTTSRSECIRSSGITLRAKSLSHSHLSGLGEVMESTGRSRDNHILSQEGATSPGRSHHHHHQNHHPSSSAYLIRNDGVVEEQDNTSAVPVAMPRRRNGASRSSVSKSGDVLASGSNSSSTTKDATAPVVDSYYTATTTTAGKKNHPQHHHHHQKRPVSISGGEKPKGGDEGRRMNDNCMRNTRTGNRPIPSVPVHLRRTQSTSSTSRCSPDSLLNCNDNNNTRDDDNDSPVVTRPKNIKLLYQDESQSRRKARAASPFLSGGSLSCYNSDKEGNFSDCSSSAEALSLGYADSGVDTWQKKHTNKEDLSNFHESPGMKSRDATGIVCTISQRIPSSSSSETFSSKGSCTAAGESSCTTRPDNRTGNKEQVPSTHPLKSSPVHDKNRRSGGDSCDDGCQKMSCSNNNNAIPASGNGNNTTVVLINGCFEAENISQRQDEQQSVHYDDSLNLSDYDFECMSEIDLNSEPGSGGSTGISARDELNEEKALKICSVELSPPHHHPSSDNELDSLDLSLFEGARRVASAECSYNSNNNSRSCSSARGTVMGVKCEGETDDEPLYDTVCFGDARFPEGSSTGGMSDNVNAWSDAGSEFEFMTPATLSNNNDSDSGFRIFSCAFSTWHLTK
jgi:hypothetical protein